MSYVPARMVIELDRLLNQPTITNKLRDQLIELADKLDGISMTVWSDKKKSSILISRYEQLRNLAAAH